MCTAGVGAVTGGVASSQDFDEDSSLGDQGGASLPSPASCDVETENSATLRTGGEESVTTAVVPETYGVAMGSGARGLVTGKPVTGPMMLEINATDPATGDGMGTITGSKPTREAPLRTSLLRRHRFCRQGVSKCGWVPPGVT